MALTATADAATEADIISRLRLNQPEVYKGSFDRPNIRYLVEEKFKPFKQVRDYIAQQKALQALFTVAAAK